MAIVTGAAGGIGRVVCQQLGNEGAAIGALDRSPAVHDLAATLGWTDRTLATAQADIADSAAVGEAMDSLRRALGPAQILVNCAGFSSRPSLAQTTPATWATDMAGNLNGTYHVTAAVMDDLIASGRGVVVNIGSVNGLASLGDPAYSAAKAGMIAFTRALATEYGPRGLRANIVCPGTVRTPIWDERRRTDPEVWEKLARWYPMGRIVEPREVAAAVCFLASDDASAISGIVLPVDCGLSAGNIVMLSELTVEQA